MTMGAKNPQITIAIIGALAATVAAYFTAMATADTRIMEVDTRVQVNERQQNLQYSELKEGIYRIEGKLDEAIKNNN